MTAMYLLFQWTEEREAKMHIGIFSTREKAQRAAQIDFDRAQTSNGEPTRALDWENTGKSFVALTDSAHDDDPYDIEEFELDVYQDDTNVYLGGGASPVRVEL